MKFRHLLLSLACAMTINIDVKAEDVNVDYINQNSTITEEGVKCFNAKDYQCAFEKMSKTAENGDVVALLHLGDMYFQGYGVKADRALGMSYLKRAADAGNITAELVLGTKYAFVDEFKDFERGLHYLGKCAEKKHAHCQVELGILWQRATDKENHKQLAAKWFYESANQGYSLGLLYYGEALLFGEGVVKDVPAAANCLELAAKRGQSTAAYYMGVIHSSGDLGKPDLKAALQWHEKALEGGIEPARQQIQVLKQLLGNS
ncbi:tetratricopeptide repeat protein [Shewanella marisflavi]|uniref:tetratricopeptide repeat protein n=1 Tax=Shewanella marisflavi TaxID=260364 RepID=UPI003AADF4E6